MCGQLVVSVTSVPMCLEMATAGVCQFPRRSVVDIALQQFQAILKHKVSVFILVPH